MTTDLSASVQPDEMCPRCVECENSEHHWLDNFYFGVSPEDLAEMDDEERADVQSATHSHNCKHCTAVGNECETCGGDCGEYEDDDDDESFVPCDDCDGEGVIRDKAIPVKVYQRKGGKPC